MARFIAFFLASLLLLPLSMCQTLLPTGETAQISHALETDASAGTVVTASDSHGGFHGDGLTFLEISFPDDSFGDRIQDTWHPLPLSENLDTFIYGSPSREPLCTEDGAHRFPPVQNGWYFFRDRHPESADPQSDLELFHRCSVNVTFALYDADTRTLYYCDFDT